MLMAKRCALSNGNLLRGGLPRNSVDMITDSPNMTSAVYHGRKASTQTNKQNYMQFNHYGIRTPLFHAEEQLKCVFDDI